MQSLTLAAYSRPDTEARQYHDPQRQGYFVMGWSTAEGRAIARSAINAKKAGNLPKIEEWRLGAGYRQRAFPLHELKRVLADPYPHLHARRNQHTDFPALRDGKTDIWLSQASFTQPNRKKIHLSRMAVCWVDLDLQHEGAPSRLASLTPDRALDLVMQRVTERGLPMPSIVLWTGRGLAVKWYLDSLLPRAAYPRWSAVQAALVDAFADLGADAVARDASRILRLVGTYNSKTGTICSPLFVNEFFGDAVRVCFDDLAHAILPLTREELAQLRARRSAVAKARKRKLQHRLTALDGAKVSSGLRPFNPVQLAWLQLQDYRTLACLRPVAKRPEGWTNTLVWLASSALAVAVWADADRWDHELVSLCRELAPHWSASRIAQATTSVRDRMAQMARGEWVDWHGKKRPPVYTPRHHTILRELGVTDAEAGQLDVIIPNELAKERDRLRQHERRRAKGVPTRQQWLEAHERRRAQARLLRAQGKTWQEIALACDYPSADAARKAAA